MRAKWGNQARNLSKSKKEIKEVKKKNRLRDTMGRSFRSVGPAAACPFTFQLV